MIKNTSKLKRIKETEKVVKKIVGNITLKCSNGKCSNKIVVKENPSSKLLCSKCNAGFFK